MAVESFNRAGAGQFSTISAAYIGSRGRRLSRTQTLFNPNPNFDFVRLTTNGASSDYHSLQVNFNRRFTRGLSALASYTWSKSLDNYSSDSASRALLISVDPNRDRGPSDFDVRHAFAGTVTYEIPSLVHSGFGKMFLRDWTMDSIFSVRSARPVNVVYGFPTSFGFAYLRPDRVNGVPLYLFDSTAAGGRLINPSAFLAPVDMRQGTLGRNSLRGFPLFQIDRRCAGASSFPRSSPCSCRPKLSIS